MNKAEHDMRDEQLLVAWQEHKALRASWNTAELCAELTPELKAAVLENLTLWWPDAPEDACEDYNIGYKMGLRIGFREGFKAGRRQTNNEASEPVTTP